MRISTIRQQGIWEYLSIRRDVWLRAAVLVPLMAAMLPASQAGDILRPKSAPSSSSGGSSGSVNPTQPGETPSAQALAKQTAQAAARANDTLLKSSQALQSLRAAQAAARVAAINGANNLGQNPNNPALTLPNVPDGLADGGLKPDSGLSAPGVANPVTSWIGANTPTQTTNAGKTKVTIEQTKQQALLNWETFNIGKNTDLIFDQSAGGANVRQWIAFNKINDPSQNPSQILGSISAPGQVYVINRNGIIFGGSSQVNTGSLVASSLPINDNLIERGLLNNPNLQFLFSSIDVNPSNFLSTVQDPTFTVDGTTPFKKISLVLAAGSSPTVRYYSSNPSDPGQKNLVLNTDYTTSVDPGDGKTVVTLTTLGLSKVGSDTLSVTYTPISISSGDVIVQSGAQLSAPTKDKVGGRIALIGANVRQGGVISTPDGQTILAAGKQVAWTSHSSADPSLRGLDVFVGEADEFTGLVQNTGIVDAARASTTVVGREIRQNGAINSTTSVELNGRIDLLANYGTVQTTLPNNDIVLEQKQSGSVVFGEGSLTDISPELSSTSKVVGTQLALASLLNIQGKTILLEDNAILRAPSANLSSGSTAVDIYGNKLLAGLTINAGVWLRNSDGRYVFANSEGVVELQSGSRIDVSGSQNVTASVADNIVKADLRGSELANSPLQRDGVLRGATIYFDATQTGIYNGNSWVGTPVADVSGYVGLVERTVGQLTSSGGTVNIRAGDGFTMASNAGIDVSGGWVNYQGAKVTTTRVISKGNIYDISEATPDRIYDGIYQGNQVSSVKWGIDQSNSSPVIEGSHYVEGYLQGGNGGSLSIVAPTMTLDGTLRGNTFAGSRQSTPGSQISTQFAGNSAMPSLKAALAVPVSSSLSVAFEKQSVDPSGNFLAMAPTPPQVVFQSNQIATAANTVVFSPEMFSDNGFGKVTINNSNGNIYVPEGVDLRFSPGAEIYLKAANMNIQGSITTPSGVFDLTVYNYSPYDLAVLSASVTPVTPLPDPGRGHFSLGPDATLSTAGLWVDQRSDPNATLFTKGGTIRIDAYDATFSEGSLLNVDGGFVVSSRSRVTYANAGGISILAGRDPGVTSILGGKLDFQSELSGYSGARGGSLSLLTPLIQIGGDSVSAPEDALVLSSAFFNKGGFASFAFTGFGQENLAIPGSFLPGVLITAGTVIDPVVASLWASPTPTSIEVDKIVLPVGERNAASLSFSAPGLRDAFNSQLLSQGRIVVEQGAVIRAEPKGSASNPKGTDSSLVGNVTISGNTVSILGSIYAPGGQITVRGASSYVGLSTESSALPTVELGSDSLLSTAGKTVRISDPLGLRAGSVFSGGSISVSGNIVAQSGSVLDVSGARGYLDLLPSYSGSTGSSRNLLSSLRTTTVVETSGGSITLTGGEQLFSDATLRGFSGGSSALGGTLTVSSGRYYPPATFATPLDVSLQVVQNGSVVPNSYLNGQSVIGKAARDSSSALVAGQGYFAADSFNQGGFDSLTLNGTIEFKGQVRITAPGRVALGSNGVIFADQNVQVNASYVSLGRPFEDPKTPAEAAQPLFTSGGLPYYMTPHFGSGALNVNADHIDVGNLSLQNIGNLSLIADQGDIRGNGVLHIAGDMLLRAGQIYPATQTSFTLVAYDHGVTTGSITIQAPSNGAVRPLPLSAGGTLNVYASSINQEGVLRAPIGTINLGWNGTGTAPRDLITGQAVGVTGQLRQGPSSITSVSAIDPVTGQGVIIPYGTINESGLWIDPSGVDITLSGLPSKSINISAQNIDNQNGSVVDLRGGGDLYAYQWVSGLGGTRDVLSTGLSFAILPSNSVPYAPFDVDYGSDSLKYGDQIFLEGVAGLSAGNYVLLPARYALLKGAFLITPLGGSPVSSSSVQADGSSIVSGYRFNSSSGTANAAVLRGSFEVVSSSVVRGRAEFKDYSANQFFTESALSHDAAIPRLPTDSGSLVLSATLTMNLRGRVLSQTSPGGLGSRVDIASPNDILIGTSETPAVSGVLVLDAANLSGFGADSLLIGGYRTNSSLGTQVTVTTGNLTVDNGGSPLQGADIILVSNANLNIAENSVLEMVPGAVARETDNLILGNSSLMGSGNGSLIRVTSDPTSSISRFGVSSSTVPNLQVGNGARIAGTTVILDSTSRASFAANATLTGAKVSLTTGRISLQLDNAGALQSDAGLVLSKSALNSLQSNAQALALASYSSIDIYGTGSIGVLNSQGAYADLSLQGAGLRGYNQSGGSVVINAKGLTLDNSPGATLPSTLPPSSSGSLFFNVDTFVLGSGRSSVAIHGFSDTTINASQELRLEGAGGISSAASLTFNTPIVTAATAADQSISALGALSFANPNGSSIPSTPTEGLGAKLHLTGGSVTLNNTILLPSGNLIVQATGGSVTVGGTLDVGGTSRNYYKLTQYTSGGNMSLLANNGSINLQDTSKIVVAAKAGGGDAGSLGIQATQGSFIHDGQIFGAGGLGGAGGDFSLDVATLDLSSVLSGNDLSTLALQLSSSGLNDTLSLRIRGGGSSGLNDDVYISDGTTVTAHSFRLSSDRGSIVVGGVIDASGDTGGDIRLLAHGSVILETGSVLTVAANDFDNAGKGGSVSLEAGSQTNGSFSNVSLGSGPQVNIRVGSSIDLSVAKNTNTTTTVANQGLGKFGGTLHLRAPQASGNNEVQIRAIDGNIVGASKITVEGYQVYTPGGGSVDSVKAAVQANGNTFAGNAASISSRLLANNTGLNGITVITPGSEIINTAGDLTLASDWNLSTFRFGSKGAAGILTMRASGNLVFNGALSDGFTGGATLRQALLMEQNGNLPTNAQSWSYNLSAGADFSSADLSGVLALGDVALSASGGSLRLGRNNPTPFSTVGANAQTNTVVGTFYQVIRTGTGDIAISTARDVQLLNQFATIYTAGVRVLDPALGGTFQSPVQASISNAVQGTLLGGVQQSPTYAAQYSLAGGNVSISAGQDIIHQTLSGSTLVADSSKELPNNWLYRRGYVDATGNFGVTALGETGSTTWWVDFSNFFEGVGTLGGGNVTLNAGRDVANVDAVAATNARMPRGKPDSTKLVELGGGDVSVHAGRDIDAGVYYVERGLGSLVAGRSLVTNSTRSPSIPTTITPGAIPFDSQTWLPTTLFLGKGDFEVYARSDLLLGPVANPFLLPQGVSNTFWYKTYFSTYDPDNTVSVTSLYGDVTLRESTTLPTSTERIPILYAWLDNVSVYRNTTPLSVSYYQPWLRLNETSVAPFSSFLNIMPSSLEVTAHEGDLNLVGNINLFPSPTGNLQIAVQGSVNALQPNGSSLFDVGVARAWTSSTINLSDADPSLISGIANPYAYQSIAGINFRFANQTASSIFNNGVLVNLDLSFITKLFQETGSTAGVASVLQNRQNLHTPGLLHRDDPEPVRVYANEGDISGLRLYSAKRSEIVAGNDITDVAFYIQNVAASDTSIVAAGRDLVAYDANSLLRAQANNSPVNQLNPGESPLAGDIQISGPGTLQVLAGRNLDLGTGSNNADGTGVGIISIGNARNPYLGSGGSDVILGAGIGSSGLASAGLDFEAFNKAFLDPTTAGDQAARYLVELGKMMELEQSSNQQVWDAYLTLSEQQQAQYSLGIFYLVLRDSGRDRNDPASPNAGSYANADAAIAALFPNEVNWTGEILTRSRDIRTRSGGDISILAPGGGVTLASSTIGSPLAPPGIITEAGGQISIFTDKDVNIGISRIFTLRGGNQIIYSANGNIAAGSSAKTVQSAPPTRVIIDPQSADVQTDLAGLATGGGIGVLDTVPGIAPGNIDLVAPNGSVDAGDAGIRSSGNLNISAVQVLNASNISVGGASAGVPVAAPSLSLGSLTAANSATSGAANAATEAAKQAQSQGQASSSQDLPSIITVEVLGYGGG